MILGRKSAEGEEGECSKDDGEEKQGKSMMVMHGELGKDRERRGRRGKIMCVVERVGGGVA